MLELNPEDMQSLVDFVRCGLGCGCPDEVFADVQIDGGPVSIGESQVDFLVKIGGRLMVGILCVPPWNGRGHREIQELIEAGMQLRDREGFNRFRLVVAIGRENDGSPSDQMLRLDTVVTDEGAHLHVVEDSDVPKFLTQRALSNRRT